MVISVKVAPQPSHLCLVQSGDMQPFRIISLLERYVEAVIHADPPRTLDYG